MAITLKNLEAYLMGDPSTALSMMDTVAIVGTLERTGRYLPEAQRLERQQQQQQIKQEAELIRDRILPRYRQLLAQNGNPAEAARQAVAELEPQLPTVMFCAPSEIQFSGSGRGKRALTTGEQIAAGIDLERRLGATDNIQALSNLRKKFIVP